MAVKVAPSVLSADFSKLGEEVKSISDQGADYIHLDVMDGHFVPNITFGPQVIKSLRSFTQVPFDVHLMIENVDQYIPLFAQAGADIITVHVEATKHLNRSLQLIKSFNIKAGVVINPHTPIEMIQHVLHLCDFVLVMTVNPGFGGQSFIDECLTKIKRLDDVRKSLGYHYLIEVDGGVNETTARLCEQMGADILVAGSFVFGHADRAHAINLIRGE
jgi:ribulose-phosphate 3-epimerase